MELIIIKTNQGEKLRKLLEKEQINYEIYQTPKQNWETQEKLALQEWGKLSDEELMAEWEKLPHD